MLFTTALLKMSNFHEKRPLAVFWKDYIQCGSHSVTHSVTVNIPNLWNYFIFYENT